MNRATKDLDYTYLVPIGRNVIKIELHHGPDRARNSGRAPIGREPIGVRDECD